MILPPTCALCGCDLTDDNTACAVDDLCDEHIAAGNCWECREAHVDFMADFWRRYHNETPEVPC